MAFSHGDTTFDLNAVLIVNNAVQNPFGDGTAFIFGPIAVDAVIPVIYVILSAVFFASTFSSKMQIEFLKVAWGISPLLHFLRRHSFGCRRGAVAGIQSLLVTDM